jgi:hypothetical protein
MGWFGLGEDEMEKRRRKTLENSNEEEEEEEEETEDEGSEEEEEEEEEPKKECAFQGYWCDNYDDAFNCDLSQNSRECNPEICPLYQIMKGSKTKRNDK